eukprot:5629224-Pleurochrysis_carterae.AAC.1
MHARRFSEAVHCPWTQRGALSVLQPALVGRLCYCNDLTQPRLRHAQPKLSMMCRRWRCPMRALRCPMRALRPAGGGASCARLRNLGRPGARSFVKQCGSRVAGGAAGRLVVASY